MEKVPRHLSALREELKKKEEDTLRLKKELEKLAVERKEKELELESNQETIRKYQAQLYTVKTNKEYAALLHEIEELKRKNARLEDEILELMDRGESGEIALDKEKKKLEEEREGYKKEEKKGEEKIAQLKNQLLQLEEKRDTLTVKIEDSLLSRYERIMKTKGTALAPVVNAACGGCHLQLPPQVISEVRLGRKVVTCERCSRILYWEKD